MPAQAQPADKVNRVKHRRECLKSAYFSRQKILQMTSHEYVFSGNPTTEVIMMFNIICQLCYETKFSSVYVSEYLQRVATKQI